MIASEIKTRPILFSGLMVRAILEGRKTQTRRVLKPQPQIVDNEPRHKPHTWGLWHDDLFPNGKEVDCPYGQPGDRLWVRESAYYDPKVLPPIGEMRVFYTDGRMKFEHGDRDIWATGMEKQAEYLREHPERIEELIRFAGLVKKPSIFMPRWACRLTLEVTGIRVERLREITEEDVEAEGLPPHSTVGAVKLWSNSENEYCGAAELFGHLWDQLNAKRRNTKGSHSPTGFAWEDNPWVWVVEFKRREP